MQVPRNETVSAEKGQLTESELGSHDNGPWRCDIGIAAFFREMERRIIAGHGPDRGEKAHDRGPSNRPFRSVRKLRPDIVTIVGLGAVDRSHRKPDHEDEDHQDVPYSPDLVDPANEPRGLHGHQAVEYEQQ